MAQRGVAKTRRARRVRRLSRTSILLEGGGGGLAISMGTRGTEINGVLIPPWTAIRDTVTTAAGAVVTGLDPAAVDALAPPAGRDGAVRSLAAQLDAVDEKDRACGGDSAACTACSEHRRCVAFHPCGHAVLCLRCARALAARTPRAVCPVCGRRVRLVSFVSI